MIAVKDLVRRFGTFTAVDGITFDVRPGEVIGFLGPNGAGKTTTIRMLTAYLPPSSGTAQVTGLDVVSDSLDVRRRIGYLPENNPLYEEMETADYLDWCGAVRGLSFPQSERSFWNRTISSRRSNLSMPITSAW